MNANNTTSRLLLVEHNAVPALDRRHYLEECGYSVVRVEDGAAALQLIDRGERFSAAIVDVDLTAKMNAVDTAAALRRRGRVPIIFLGRPEAGADPAADGQLDYVSYAERDDASRLLPVLQNLGLRPEPKSKSRSRAHARRGRVSGPEYGAYFYESIIRSISDVVTVIDDKGVVRYTSPSIETHFGYKPNELSGSAAVDFVHPDDRDMIEELFRETLKHPSRYDVVECRYRLPDSRYVWVEGRATGYSDANISRGMLVSYQDISSRVEAREALEKALREKELLISEVHHRIKNDLNLVNSMLSLQAARCETSEAARSLENARHRIGLMGQIYEQLYRSELTGEVDMKSVVNRLVDDIRRAGLHSNVHIQIDVYSVTLSTRLALSVGLIVNEIVTNSLKYAAPDGGPLEISGSIAPSPDRADLEISIRDSGEGFPNELIDHRSEGFGMTIVRALTQQHDGELTLENDSGAVVYVRLPITG